MLHLKTLLFTLTAILVVSTPVLAQNTQPAQPDMSLPAAAPALSTKPAPTVIQLETLLQETSQGHAYLSTPAAPEKRVLPRRYVNGQYFSRF